jgi:hypothetical protein
MTKFRRMAPMTPKSPPVQVVKDETPWWMLGFTVLFDVVVDLSANLQASLGHAGLYVLWRLSTSH